MLFKGEGVLRLYLKLFVGATDDHHMTRCRLCQIGSWKFQRGKMSFPFRLAWVLRSCVRAEQVFRCFEAKTLMIMMKGYSGLVFNDLT